MEGNCKQKKIGGGIRKKGRRKGMKGFDKTKSLFSYVVTASDDLGLKNFTLYSCLIYTVQFINIILSTL
jgi:hypothetical protein